MRPDARKFDSGEDIDYFDHLKAFAEIVAITVLGEHFEYDNAVPARCKPRLMISGWLVRLMPIAVALPLSLVIGFSIGYLGARHL